MGSGLFVCEIACCESDRFRLLSRQRLNESEASAVAAVAKLYCPADLGEQRIVLADADIEAGLDRCPALPHDDGAAGDYLAAEGLDTQPLGIRVASVS